MVEKTDQRFHASKTFFPFSVRRTRASGDAFFKVCASKIVSKRSGSSYLAEKKSWLNTSRAPRLSPQRIVSLCFLFVLLLLLRVLLIPLLLVLLLLFIILFMFLLLRLLLLLSLLLLLRLRLLLIIVILNFVKKVYI